MADQALEVFVVRAGHVGIELVFPCHARLKHLFGVRGLGRKQLRILRQQSAHAEALRALLLHLLRVGALGVHHALVQREVVHPGAARLLLLQRSPQVHRQLQLQAVVRSRQVQRLASQFEVNHPQSLSRRPAVHAVDAALQDRVAHLQPRGAVLPAEAALQLLGAEGAALHLLRKHPRAAAGRGPKHSGLRPCAGTVLHRRARAHALQQHVGDAAHARLGLCSVHLVQLPAAHPQKFVHRLVQEGAHLAAIQLEGLHALRAQTVGREVGERTVCEALQPRDALGLEPAVERARSHRVDALPTLIALQHALQAFDALPDLGKRAARLPQRRGSGEIALPCSTAVPALRNRPGREGGGRSGRGRQQAVQLHIARRAADGMQRGEDLPHQLHGHARSLGGAVAPPQRAGEPDLPGGHAQGGL